MIRSYLNLAVCLTVVTLFSSCAKEGPTGPTGPAGPSYTGAISGHVHLYDKYGSEVLTGLSAPLLSLNGGVAISPDANGYYIYNNVTTGSYNIAVSATGYASTLVNNFAFLTGTLNKDIKLSAIPDSFVYGFHAYHNTGSLNDSLVLNLSADTRTRYCIVFANSIPAVGNLPAYYLWYKVISVSPTAPVVAFTIPRQDLTDLGLASGGKVYYAVYSYVVNDASVYEDLGTGKNVFNAVNSQPTVDSTLVP